MSTPADGTLKLVSDVFMDHDIGPWHTQLKYRNTYSFNITEPRKGYVGKHKDGWKLPNWRYLVSTGQNATTPYSMSGYNTVVDSSPHVRFNWGVTSGYNSGESLGFPQNLTPWINNPISPYKHPPVIGSSAYSKADNIARERYYARVRKVQSMAQAMVPIAEFRDIGRTVGVVSDSVIDLLRLITARRFTSKRDMAHRIADYWLTWSFGIKPALSDFESIKSSLARSKFGANPKTLSIKGRGEEITEVNIRDWGGYGIFSGCGNMAIHLREITNVSVKYHHSFLPDWFAPHSDLEGILHNLGFSALEIPALIWELIGYSWLVDYFANVQIVLNALGAQTPNPAWGYKNSRGSATRRFYSDQSFLPSTKPPPEILSDMDLTLETFSFQREHSDWVPLPGLRLKEIDEIVAHGDTKIKNVLACIVVNSANQRATYRGLPSLLKKTRPKR